MSKRKRKWRGSGSEEEAEVKKKGRRQWKNVREWDAHLDDLCGLIPPTVSVQGLSNISVFGDRVGKCSAIGVRDEKCSVIGDRAGKCSVIGDRIGKWSLIGDLNDLAWADVGTGIGNAGGCSTTGEEFSAGRVWSGKKYDNKKSRLYVHTANILGSIKKQGESVI